MASQYKKSWQTFADVTTIHGVHDMVFANAKITRVLWVVVILASVSMLGYQAFKIFRDYHEGATSFRTSTDPLDKFPPIRIFSRNFINFNQAKRLNLKNKDVCFLMCYFKDWPHNDLIGDSMMVETEGSDGRKYWGMDKSNLENMEQHIAAAIRSLQKENPSVQNVVHLAENLTYDGSKIVTVKSLSWDTAEPTVRKLVDPYGISYIIETSKKIHNGSGIFGDSAGALWGFSLKQENIPSICEDEDRDEEDGDDYDDEDDEEDNSHKTSKTKGVRLSVGDGILKQNQWIKIYPRTSYNLLISPYARRLINKRSRPCRDGNIPKAKCHRDCQVQLYNYYDYANGDDCSTYICPLNGTVFFSGDSTYSGRFYNWLHGLTDSNCNQTVREKIKACISSCIDPCEQEGFKVQVTEFRNIIGTTGSTYESLVRKQISIGSYDVWVKMAPRWSVDSVKEEYKYGVETLMSSFGGLLGLFIGASLISILQLMVYTFCGTWVTKNDAGVATEASAEKKDGGKK